MISDIKDDTSTSVTAQESCKVLQRIIDTAMHEKNWLQLISTWEMSIQCCYDNVQVWQRREHHELEKAFRNRERSDNNYSNNTFNEYIESISSCDIIEESNEREKK